MKTNPTWWEKWEPYNIPAIKSNFFLTVDEAISLLLEDDFSVEAA